MAPCFYVNSAALSNSISHLAPNNEVSDDSQEVCSNLNEFALDKGNRLIPIKVDRGS